MGRDTKITGKKKKKHKKKKEQNKMIGKIEKMIKKETDISKFT